MTESGRGCSGDCNEQHAKHYDDDAEDSKHRGGNEHSRDNKSTNGRINVGSPDNLAGIYPDFVTIAQGFGVKARRVHKKSELREAIQEMLDHDGPYVLDVIVPYTEHVLPMIPAGKTVKDMLLK